MTLLDQISERDISGLTEELLVAEMQMTGKCRLILDSIKDIALAAERKDLDEVVALYHKGYSNVFVNNDSGSDDADLLSIASTSSKFNWRTTGFKAIDERNGISTGSLVLLCGDTGTGKSTAAHSMGVHQFKKYEDSVFYASWEQGVKEITTRIFSYESDIDLGKIMDDVMTAEERVTLRTAKLNLLFTANNSQVNEYVAANTHLDEEAFLVQAGKDLEIKPNKFYIFDKIGDFDDLMVRMELMLKTKNVRTFIVDYLTIIPAGAGQRGYQSWELYIKMSQRLKNFARVNDVLVITPLQYDSKEGKIKFSKNIENDADLSIRMSQDKEDLELNSVTWSFGKYRNFKTIMGKPLAPFKLVTAFDRAKFEDMEF